MRVVGLIAAETTKETFAGIDPAANDLDGQQLFTLVDAERVATPLLAVLLRVEATDVLFAVDSVQAVLAVSREQFIVVSSNAFEILGDDGLPMLRELPPPHHVR